MKTIGIPPRTPQAWDLPADEVAQQVACDVALKAMTATHSESDRIAYAQDVYLIGHPEACSKDEDYPGFADWVARQVEKNRAAVRKSKEAK